MTDLQEKAMRMALDALEIYGAQAPAVNETIEALRQALAQPKQYDQTALELCEKCGWKAIIPDEGCLVCARKEQEPYCYAGRQYKNYCEVFPLYKAPPKREWVGLTNEEIDGIYKTHHDQYGKCQTGGFEYERTIEAKLKEKNT